MIPILYEKTETTFTSEGLGRFSDCISCVVTEERNGIYEVEFQYPVNGALFDDIQIGRIIACTHDEQGDVQPFDIYAKSEPINGIVTFNAHHISYRMNEITVEPFTASSCAAALTGLKNNSIGTNPFTFNTNKSVSATYILSVPSSCRAMLGGTENSILDVFGVGEYQWDKFNVYLWTSRGVDTNVSIRYGKNLVDFTNELDYSESYNAVAPYWFGQVQDEATASPTNLLVTLTEKYISSGNTLPSGRLVVAPMDCSSDFQTPPTEAQLRSLATTRLNAGYPWYPSQNISVDFVQLWQTEEYKQFALLQKVKLCDTVLIDVPMYNITGQRIKVIKVEWNVLLDRYDKMELGTPQTTLAGAISQNLPTMEEIEKLKKIVDTNRAITGNTNQHFWFTESGTDTGAHITEVERDEFLVDPYNGGGNLLARSNGIAVRDGMTELSTFAAGGIRIGQADQDNVQIGTDGTEFYNDSEKVGSIRQFAYSADTNAMKLTTEKIMLLNVGDPTKNGVPWHQVVVGKDRYQFDNGDSFVSSDAEDNGPSYFTIHQYNLNKSNREVALKADSGSAEVWFGIGSDGIDHGVYSVNNGTWMIHMIGDGYVRIPAAYNKTSTIAINACIGGNGVITRNTSSSKRYKKNIEDIEGAEALYDVKVRQFKYRDDYLDSEDQRYDKTVCGFIVEELDDVYPIAVDYVDEQPEDWNMRYMIPPMLKLIQDQKKMIDELTERIEALERSK